MKTLWIFGNQLNMDLKGFSKINRKKDVVLMIESKARAQWQWYHQQKLVLVFSAMRHFSKHLEAQGYQVDYYQVPSFEKGLKQHLAKYSPEMLIMHRPSDLRLRSMIDQLMTKENNHQFEILTFNEQPMFLIEEEEWETLLPDNKSWTLDPIYRLLRKKFNSLMDGDGPLGGQWNYDEANRQPPKKGLTFESPLSFQPDVITQQVIKEVKMNFPDNFGIIETFDWPVTRQEATKALDHFINYRLGNFGPYQDAMIEDQPFTSHSLISGAINLGLLTPLEVIAKVETAYHEQKIALASVEGFIRQILGWREYVRGYYFRWLHQHRTTNYFKHDNALPDFYWTGNTNMYCLSTCVNEVKENAYNHHIQRLMVLCNFANLVAVDPKAVVDWFQSVYIDAYDWVVLPNVLGMGLYADGGIMATKPYISSGSYIKKMSNYCQQCDYNVNKKTGDKACPFNSLYWHFLDRNQERLQSNPRMKLMYHTWHRMDANKRKAILNQGDIILKDY